MKKMFVALFIILTISSFCSIQLPSAGAEEAKTFVGTIKSMKPVFGRPPKWPCARFSAVADDGEEIEIYVLGASGASATSVTDFNGKPVEKPGYNHRPQVGKKVEVTYSTGEHEIYGGKRYEAISIRYVPADYTQQAASSPEQTPLVTPAKPSLSPAAQSGNIVIGRIYKVLPIPPGFRNNHNCVLDVIPDGDEKYMSFALKDAAITYFDGKPLAVQDLQKGERVEVKYPGISRTSLDGVQEAAASSVRYVPPEYTRQTAASTAQTVSAQAAQGTSAQPGNTFIGTIESFPYGFGHFKSGPPLWPVGMIVVNADNGGKSNFLIVRDGPSATVFYDADGKVAPVLSDIKGMKDINALIGKRVEVKYAVTAESMRYLNKQLAVSVRFVPADYVPQPPARTGDAEVAQPAAAIASEGPGHAAKDNIFVGKVVKGGVTFSVRCPYRFVIVTDNGETKDIWIPRDGLTITDVNGKPVVGAPPRKGKRMEIKYLIGDNGQYEAVSMRYVP